MNVFDWIVLAILAVTLFYGYKTGLVDSVVTTIAVYVSLVLGGQFAGRVLSLLPLSVENEALSTAIGYVIIFVAVFIASRIVSGAANATLEKISVVDWANTAGGIVLGVVMWVLLAGALMTVTARYTYVFEDPNKGGNPSQRAAREVVVNDARNSLDDMLTGSAFIPLLLEFRNVMPGGMLGMAPANFGTALDILDKRASN